MRKMRARERKLLPRVTQPWELGFRAQPVSEASATPFSLPNSVPEFTLTGAVHQDPDCCDSRHVAWARQLRVPLSLVYPPFTSIPTRIRVGSGKGVDRSSGPNAPSCNFCFALRGDTGLPQLVRVESGFEPGSGRRGSLVPWPQTEHRGSLLAQPSTGGSAQGSHRPCPEHMGADRYRSKRCLAFLPPSLFWGPRLQNICFTLSSPTPPLGLPGTAERMPGNPWLRGPQGPTDSHHLTLFKLLLFLDYPSNTCSLQEN